MKPAKKGFTLVELLVVIAIIVFCFLPGCRKESPYPDRVPVSPIGMSTPCDTCGTTCVVSEENLVEFQGNQYTVCNETCAEKLRQNVAAGAHESQEHGHEH
jgi:prepilin-type N-terminal cleavage/methylation domain-containing protein